MASRLGGGNQNNAQPAAAAAAAAPPSPGEAAAIAAVAAAQLEGHAGVDGQLGYVPPSPGAAAAIAAVARSEGGVWGCHSWLLHLVSALLLQRRLAHVMDTYEALHAACRAHPDRPDHVIDGDRLIIGSASSFGFLEYAPGVQFAHVPPDSFNDDEDDEAQRTVVAAAPGAAANTSATTKAHLLLDHLRQQCDPVTVGISWSERRSRFLVGIWQGGRVRSGGAVVPAGDTWDEMLKALRDGIDNRNNLAEDLSIPSRVDASLLNTFQQPQQERESEEEGEAAAAAGAAGAADEGAGELSTCDPTEGGHSVIDVFEATLGTHPKEQVLPANPRFKRLSEAIGTKTTDECIEFYYTFKHGLSLKAIEGANRKRKTLVRKITDKVGKLAESLGVDPPQPRSGDGGEVPSAAVTPQFATDGDERATCLAHMKAFEAGSVSVWLLLRAMAASSAAAAKSRTTRHRSGFRRAAIDKCGSELAEGGRRERSLREGRRRRSDEEENDADMDDENITTGRHRCKTNSEVDKLAFQTGHVSVYLLLRAMAANRSLGHQRRYEAA
ncbi:unnamed protein product [Vitrella brassicaformis CCMP3155]|uniref:SANT domain-containing protein n=1 Tax=Vitrella brassicaformis (strain CCMP3155) TaxID=1169540 RepID=A0A0G4H3W2_VITBC|nr:unnamed protein product [Vitrella brassicaformis CCMP3155]|eukprot:CEM38394.1 unnamed protein product [Vitrella brassicaformis CCMP3155]